MDELVNIEDCKLFEHDDYWLIPLRGNKVSRVLIGAAGSLLSTYWLASDLKHISNEITTN